MAGLQMDIEVKDHGIEEMLAKLQGRMHDLTPVMKIVGQIGRASIVRNFEKEGRPKRWKPHSEITQRRRGTGAPILRDEDHLMNSIHDKAYRDRTVIGTNRVYAAIHHFGGKAGRKRKVTIPARPFMMIQDEDWTEIRESLKDFIMGARG